MSSEDLQKLIDYFSEQGFENGIYKIKSKEKITDTITKIVADVFINRFEAFDDQLYIYETFYLIEEEEKSFKAISYVMGKGKDIHSYVNPQYRGQKIIFNSLPYILDDLFKSYKELRISINRSGEFNKQSKKLVSAFGFKRRPIETYYGFDGTEDYYYLSKIRFKRALMKLQL